MLENVACIVDTAIHPFELGIVSEVFGVDRSDEGLPNFDFAVCATSPTGLPAAGGLQVSANHDMSRVAGADLVVVPAWRTDPVSVDPAVDTAINAALKRGATVLTVCSGAFLLAQLGLLDGRAATCHWMHSAAFRARFPSVTLEADRLYVEDGQIVSSAGSAAGIDACLYLIRREFGAKTASAFARRMVVPPHRDGGQSQFIDRPVPAETDGSQTVSELLEWIRNTLTRRHDVKSLAAYAHMSPRTFARRFAAQTGSTPYDWITRQRVVYAQELLENTALTIDEIAQQSGFSSGDIFRHHFANELATTPTSYRKRFQQT